MQHTKYYKDIKVPTDQLVKKLINYSNPTAEAKAIRIVSNSPFIKVREANLEIRPYSSGAIRLRMFFDSSSGRYQEGSIRIEDEDNIE